VRASHSDGDPFSGWWRTDGSGSEAYHKALAFISQSSSSSKAQIFDGRLQSCSRVDVHATVDSAKWSATKEILTECITQCAGEAREMHMISISFPRAEATYQIGVAYSTMLSAASRFQMQPEDPMPYFWTLERSCNRPSIFRYICIQSPIFRYH